MVHLAGESIAKGRLNEAKKQRLTEQRVNGTRRLMEALAGLAVPTRTVVSAAAVGFYCDRGNDVVDEDSVRGSGYLADLCLA